MFAVKGFFAAFCPLWQALACWEVQKREQDFRVLRAEFNIVQSFAAEMFML